MSTLSQQPQTENEVDLSLFTDSEYVRQQIKQPWSAGQWTYATNGHILVRVPRRISAPEIENPVNAERYMADHLFDGARTSQMPYLPPIRPIWVCIDETISDDRVLSLNSQSAALCGGIFALHYLHLIASLPMLRLGHASGPRTPLPFLFGHSGRGSLMPLDGPGIEHYDIDGSVADALLTDIATNRGHRRKLQLIVNNDSAKPDQDFQP